MAAYNKLQQFVADLANGKHNLGSDVLKVGLTNSAPVATNTMLFAGNGGTRTSTYRSPYGLRPQSG